jgi:hypothetical protein
MSTSLLEWKGSFGEFIARNYAGENPSTNQRKEDLIQLMDGIFGENLDSLEICRTRGNGYCPINAYMIYLLSTGTYTPEEIDQFYVPTKDFIITLMEQISKNELGEEIYIHRDSEINLQLDLAFRAISEYYLITFGRPMRISIIRYNEYQSPPLRKIIFNEDYMEDHYMFLTLNGHLYTLYLPKDKRVRIII